MFAFAQIPIWLRPSEAGRNKVLEVSRDYSGQLCGVILSFFFFFLHFKTSPHLLQLCKRMLFYCEAPEMFCGLRNFTCLSIDTGNYVPTVFENYTASFEIDKHRIELNMWDTSGSSYYDNVRPLAYPDSDAVLICFDISRPETLDSVIKKWQGETQEFCPNAKVVLVGCKLDMRTDVNTLRELSKQRLIPVTHEQGSTIGRQIGAVAYVECTSKVSENSVRDVFHVTTVASVRRPHKPQLKRSSSRRGLKRVSQLPLPPLPGRTEQMDQAPAMRKDRAKSCVLM
ncbi:rho-related GTP-binding protein RhoN isoform 1-T1 [Acanthopagrus schlegelii]